MTRCLIPAAWRKRVTALVAASAMALLGGCTATDQAAVADFLGDFGRSLLAAWLL